MTKAGNSQIIRTIPLLITIFSISLPAYAKYSGGTGEPNDPYQIATAEDLMLLGETPEDYDKHFILTADIDLDPNLPGRRVFDRAVIAANVGFYRTYFTGSFDGDGHTISHLTIKGTGRLGLFGTFSSFDAEIKGVGLVDVNITGSGSPVGGLVGENAGTVIQCYSKGVVNGTYEVGGLVGENHDIGSIANCYSSGSVSGDYTIGGLVGYNDGSITESSSIGLVRGSFGIGGLLGSNDYKGSIANCYSSGSVSGTGSDVGGLVSINEGRITASYTIGSVTGESGVGGLIGCNIGEVTNCCSVSTVAGNSAIGGLVGVNFTETERGGGIRAGLVAQCYSTGKVSGTENVGGLVGMNKYYSKISGEIEANVDNSFWDTETSGQTTSDGGIGKTTAEMQTASTFINAGWDFAGEIENGTHEVWQIPEAGGYPLLSNFSGYTPPKLQGTGTVDDPYLISNALELGSVIHYSPYAHYLLANPIDLSGICWSTSVIPQLWGIFDGNGHAIKNLHIQSGTRYVGMFGQIGSSANVSNLALESVDVNGTAPYVGSLAGSNDGSITECSSSGLVSGSYSVGGLVGSNDGSITESSSSGLVSGTDILVGGLVGRNAGSIVASSSSGSVSGYVAVGGLVGDNYGGSIVASYSTGSVRGYSRLGGLAGENWGGSATRCYSAGVVSGTGQEISGLVGLTYGGSVTGCFWDIQTSTQSGSDGGAGLTTAEMMDPYMLGLNGFANDPNWVLDAGRDYPRLAWERTPGRIVPEPHIDWLAGQGTADGPYRIDTTEQLILLSKASILWNRHFVLGADIDLDPTLPGRYIFGQAVIPVFAGVFDGRGHVISHLTIAGGRNLGLFGSLTDTAEVRNIGVVDVNIIGSGGNIGALAGYSDKGSIVACFSRGSVTGDDQHVGGLVGYNLGSIAACYSRGSVSGHVMVGGLVGRNDWGSIATSYSSASVTGTAEGGGLVGGYGGAVNSSFWDMQTSGQTSSSGGTGKTTAEMQMASTFRNAGWDFVDEAANGTEDIWWILEGQDYPRLWWEKE